MKVKKNRKILESIENQQAEIDMNNPENTTGKKLFEN